MLRSCDTLMISQRSIAYGYKLAPGAIGVPKRGDRCLGLLSSFMLHYSNVLP